MKILRICSVPLSLIGYKSFLRDLAQHSDVSMHIATSFDEQVSLLKQDEFYEMQRLEIKREIDPLSDIISILKAIFLINKIRPDITHSNTPKGGLVSAISSFVCRVPVRIHTFTGQRWITLNGFKRKLLMFVDRLIILLSTHVLADSPSQADFLNSELGIDKVKCLGEGSFGGIDLNKFNSKNVNEKVVRGELGFKDSDFVILYLGRISKDKGIEELIQAFIELNSHNLKLLLVGPYEKNLDPISEAYEEIISDNTSIKRVDFTDQPEKYFSVCNLFCLPSYREGFGTVILEAAAFSKASLGSDIYGIRDAILHQDTGLLFNPKSVDDLKEKISFVVNNPVEWKSYGENAYKRLLNHFDYKLMSKNYADFYRSCLSEKSL